MNPDSTTKRMRALISEQVEEDDSVDEGDVAKDLIGDLSERALRHLAFAWLVDETWRLKRNKQRLAQRRVDKLFAEKVSAPEEVENRRRRQERWKAEAAYIDTAVAFVDNLLSTEFALGDGRRITWRDATVEDHTQRIEYIQKRVDGLEQDIMLHEQALQLLEKYSVSTLGSLPNGGQEMLDG